MIFSEGLKRCFEGFFHPEIASESESSFYLESFGSTAAAQRVLLTSLTWCSLNLLQRCLIVYKLYCMRLFPLGTNHPLIFTSSNNITIQSWPPIGGINLISYDGS